VANRNVLTICGVLTVPTLVRRALVYVPDLCKVAHVVATVCPTRYDAVAVARQNGVSIFSRLLAPLSQIFRLHDHCTMRSEGVHHDRVIINWTPDLVTWHFSVLVLSVAVGISMKRHIQLLVADTAGLLVEQAKRVAYLM